ncbi:MAG: DUF1254 domain-containing protein [Archaeoglobaceae archaeon]|nr:DUF1254 domain-containing protein [Archaeoglobaceae archaeon]MDW8118208.1 DUF1254 domain-containing protein [Archaeoglobaceae archaeon]
MKFEKENAKGLAILVLFALLSHFLLLYSYPYIVVISNYLATRDEVEVNEAYHQKPVDETFRKVVMPSPDLLYSACVFDISKSDLLIEAKVPNFTYWSASFYSMSTDNFFTINDKMAKEKISLTLTKNKSCENKDCIISPSDRGIVIFRIFIPDKSLLPELMEYQKTIKCKSVREKL